MLDHRKFGEHSGFKECCIDFWLNEWIHAFDDKPSKQQILYSKEYLRSIPNPGYVPCPTCKETRDFVKVHRCGPECLPFLLDIGMDVERAFWIMFDRATRGCFPTPAGSIITYVAGIQKNGKPFTINNNKNGVLF